MHIPDGFLDTKTLAVTNLLSLSIFGLAVQKVNAKFTPDRIPLMGVLAAFAFVAQLLAFPVVGGTSAHITGAVLLAVIVGPYTSLVLIGVILMMQSLLFQHGGILTFGANLLNLGVVGALGGYVIYRIGNNFFTVGLAAFITVMIGGMLAGFELAWSGRMDLHAALIGMSSAQFIVGVLETFVTVSILTVIKQVRPDLLQLEKI